MVCARAVQCGSLLLPLPADVPSAGDFIPSPPPPPPHPTPPQRRPQLLEPGPSGSGGGGEQTDRQLIEEYAQRARDASGGGDPTAPLFRWAAGIDSHQKQELLAVIDGLHLANQQLQEQLVVAENEVCLFGQLRV